MARRRWALGLLGQGVASAASLLTLAAAGHALIGDELGKFALVFSTAVIVLSLVRSFTGEALLVTPGPQSLRRTQNSAALGLALLAGLTVTACLALVGAAWGPGESRSLVWASAALAPALLLYDCLRHVLIRQRRFGPLVAADSATAAGQVASIYVISTVFGSAAGAVLGWAGATTLATVILLAAVSYRPTLRTARAWLTASFHRSSAFAAEAILGAAVGYATLLAMAAWADTLEVAAFRAALSVFGFTSVLASFLRSVALSELANRGSALSPRDLNRTAALMVVSLFAALTTAFLVLELLPREVGDLLLGSLWGLVNGILLPAVVNRFASLLAVVPIVLLRVQGVAWEATRRRTWVMLAGFALGPVGGALWGASGALYLESVTYSVTALVLWNLSDKIARRGQVGAAPTRNAEAA